MTAGTFTYDGGHVSDRYWLFERAQLITEFKRKGALPPPLNLLSLVAVDLPHAARRRRRRAAGGGAVPPTEGAEDGRSRARDGFKLVPGPEQLRRLQVRGHGWHLHAHDMHMYMLHVHMLCM